MAKLHLSYLEKELCGLTPTAVDTPSEDELGAKSALPKKGFIPIEEVGVDGVPIGLLSAGQLQDCMDPLDFVELLADVRMDATRWEYIHHPLARNMRLV